MIYGLVPVGGKGTRLSLPYSKEMLPQKDYDYFNPVVNHTVEKMELAGAEVVVFVHGEEFKADVRAHFSGHRYMHIRQDVPGFAGVLKDFWTQVRPEPQDRVIFGLPDTVYDGNPFVEMLHCPGICCGLFTTDDDTKVDRLRPDGSFDVKSPKCESNSREFWGVLKFDAENLARMVERGDFEADSEIGNILNRYEKGFVSASGYLDLGTWVNYNRYLQESVGMSNKEIERKYDASLVSFSDFDEFMSNIMPQCRRQEIVSNDYYFTNDNPNIEFVRFREAPEKGMASDITVKNFRKSQLNRFELVLKLDPEVTSEKALQFIGLSGAKFAFRVRKRCVIFYGESHTVVMYSFEVNQKEFRIIEIEIDKSNINLLGEMEAALAGLPGFDRQKTIGISKFQMIRREMGL